MFKLIVRRFAAAPKHFSNRKKVGGVFALYKPAGLTSATAVSKVKRILGNLSRVGHAGTLDKAAEGVLVLGVGTGCKLLGTFVTAPKEYVTQVTFGVATDTYDIDGQVIEEMSTEHITKEAVEAALQSFRTATEQSPPPFSAIKVNGERLSDIAKDTENSECLRPGPRAITVHDITLIDFLPDSSPEFIERHARLEMSHVHKLMYQREQAMGKVQQQQQQQDQKQHPRKQEVVWSEPLQSQLDPHHEEFRKQHTPETPEERQRHLLNSRSRYPVPPPLPTFPFSSSSSSSSPAAASPSSSSSSSSSPTASSSSSSSSPTDRKSVV